MTGNEQRVGFVGLGTMGAAMANRLLEQGTPLTIHDVFAEAGTALIDKGARWATSLAELARESDIVLLSLPGPPEVTSVVAGPEGLLENLDAGAIVVDLSTNSIETARKLAAAAHRREIEFIDSPVSGGSAGASQGTLVLMVGGTTTAVERARPLLSKLSRKLFHLGESGAGTIAKLVNNQLYLCGEMIFFEGLVLAAKAGLEPESLCEILDLTGAGGVHSRLAPRVLERRYDDRTFTLGLAEKDLALTLEASRTLGVPMPTTTAAHELFAEALARGLRDKNFWAAIEVVEQHANVRVTQDDPDS